jgi:hypothetical protein
MPSPNGPWFQNADNEVPKTVVCNNLWIEKKNRYLDEEHQKSWSCVITGPDAGKYEYITSVGYRTGAEADKWDGTFTGSKLEGQTRTFTIQMKQPDREVVKLHRFAELSCNPDDTTFAIIHNGCSVVTTSGSRLDLQDARFGTSGIDASRIVEVVIFPQSVPVNTGAAHVFQVPPETGTWTRQIVYVDPDGHAQPQGGVLWTSDGPGLTPEDACNVQMFMTDLADSTYHVYAFDAEAGEWQYFKWVHAQAIPTLSEWGLIVLGALLLITGGVFTRRVLARERQARQAQAAIG